MTYLYEPLNILNELNSLLENSVPRRLRLDDSKVATSHWLPSVDIKEEATQFVVYADLPGVSAEQIEISMQNNILTLKGARVESKQEETSNYFRTERIKGDFYRRFTLPDTADGDNIRAKTKHGVLEIIIPKKQIASLRKIAIETQE